MAREDHIPKAAGKKAFFLSPDMLSKLQKLFKKPDVVLDPTQFDCEKKNGTEFYKLKKGLNKEEVRDAGGDYIHPFKVTYSDGKLYVAPGMIALYHHIEGGASISFTRDRAITNLRPKLKDAFLTDDPRPFFSAEEEDFEVNKQYEIFVYTKGGAGELTGNGMSEIGAASTVVIVEEGEDPGETGLHTGACDDVRRIAKIKFKNEDGEVVVDSFWQEWRSDIEATIDDRECQASDSESEPESSEPESSEEDSSSIGGGSGSSGSEPESSEEDSSSGGCDDAPELYNLHAAVVSVEGSGGGFCYETDEFGGVITRMTNIDWSVTVDKSCPECRFQGQLVVQLYLRGVNNPLQTFIKGYWPTQEIVSDTFRYKFNPCTEWLVVAFIDMGPKRGGLGDPCNAEPGRYPPLDSGLVKYNEYGRHYVRGRTPGLCGSSGTCSIVYEENDDGNCIMAYDENGVYNPRPTETFPENC